MAVDRITLRPVDGVHVTTVMDNAADMLLPDEGLVRRCGLTGSAGPLPVLPAALAEDGVSYDFLRAEHGFSALIEVRDGDATRRVLFDAGVTPDGLIGNLDRLDLDPATFEAVVLSHGHFDHVMGLQGLAGRLGRRDLPVLLHPVFWSRRRLAVPTARWTCPPPAARRSRGSASRWSRTRSPRSCSTACCW